MPAEVTKRHSAHYLKTNTGPTLTKSSQEELNRNSMETQKPEFLIRKMLLNRFVSEIRISLFVLVSRIRTVQSEPFLCFYFGTDFQRYFKALKDNIN